MRITQWTSLGAGLLAVALISGCGGDTAADGTASQDPTAHAPASSAAPSSTGQPGAGLSGLTEDQQFEWALTTVDAVHPGGAESIRLGRGVCTQFDNVQSYTYGTLWLVKNSGGFYTKVDQVSGLVAAAVAMYCPEHTVAVTDDPGLTVDREGKVSVDTGDSIGDLLPD